MKLAGETLDRFDTIDILVNNAAAPAEFVPFESSTLEIQGEELTTLMGALHCSRSVLPSMIGNRRGRIISITSIAGRFGQPRRAIYSAAKAGIQRFSKALSAEVGQYGITVNCGFMPDQGRAGERNRE
jgi:3-oxoacyl-[acyl-carrier protein] reductase